MNSNEDFLMLEYAPKRSLAGAALVIVLSFLAIIIVLVLSLASTSIMERRASSVADASLTSELLANLVENIVQSQLRMATTQTSTMAWVSQPGMIRVYSNNGSLVWAYKLYSGWRPKVLGEDLSNELAFDGGLIASDANAALVTDLNRPAVFQSVVSYPIADPRALGKVDGFSYDGTTDPDKHTQNFTIKGSSQSLPVIPMPVQWMYLLRNGKVVAPDPTTGNGRQISLSGASATNPVIGRIAYWADDESCKLNLNTAADGNYWDTPRVGGTSDSIKRDPDRKFAKYQPAQGEYQRYTGHPATTSLRPVFEKYLPSTLSDSELRESLIGLAPRYSPGGSMGGTVNPGNALTPVLKPLYSSPDELYFDPDRVSRQSLLSDEALDQTRFFVTASSRAPEVNLFDMPRVSLWPVNSDTSARTAYDKTNVFCSTLGATGTNSYTFTRSSPRVSDGELNSSFPRNLELYSYLNSLMQKPIPGVGQSFSSKYGADQPQILTEIYDFIRCTNICDQSASNAVPFTPKPDMNGPAIKETPNSGQIRPTIVQSNNTRGFGRFPTISEAALTILGEKNIVGGSPYYNARAVLLLEMACVSQGPAGYGANFSLSVSGLSNFDVQTELGTKKLFPSDTGSTDITTSTAVQNQSWGGTMGLTMVTLYDKAKPLTSYPLIGDTFSFTTSPIAKFSTFINDTVNNTFTVSGGTITVTLKFPNDSANPVQTFTLRFPGFTSRYPMPWIPESQLGAENGKGADWANLQVRLTKDTPSRRIPVILDVTKSIVPAGGAIGCDLRLLSLASSVSDDVFRPNNNYYNQNVGCYNGSWSQVASHSLTRWHGPCANSGGLFKRRDPITQIESGTVPIDGAFGNFVKDVICGGKSDGYCMNDIPKAYYDASNNLVTVNGVVNSMGKPGDIDTGISLMADGPWINKPDEGEAPLPSPYTGDPYYVSYQQAAMGASLFSPNRQVSSAIQLGSLPAGVKAGRPWQTLLFCPNPAALTYYDGISPKSDWHPGFVTPNDHFLLDLFWMPVVEPYAISDPCSTAGKVNLNYTMVPFSTIKRDTAVRGVLRNVKIQAIPKGQSAEYKGRIQNLVNTNYRYPINVDNTMAEINQNLANNGVYLSASQICEVFLIPKNDNNPTNPNPVTVSSSLDSSGLLGTNNFWELNKLTGDNVRERPYSAIYPRLTTKSNVFTVHYTVQALKKVHGSLSDGWDEDRDKVLGEQRGATTIERYIDPRDPEFSLPEYDFAARINHASPPTLGRFYKFRTVSNRQFRQ